MSTERSVGFLTMSVICAVAARQVPADPLPTFNNPTVVSGAAVPVGEGQLPAPVQAPPRRPRPLRANQVLFNFQDADIRAVVKAVSDMTGRNFILDPQVHGKITIISGSPVSRYAAYQIFLAALKAQGFAAVPAPGAAVRVVPQAEGTQSAPVGRGGPPPGGDELVTEVVALGRSQASDMVPLLRPLMAPSGVLSAYPPANMLVITDYADNIRRLLRVIHEVDQEGHAHVAVVPLHYASALDMATLVSRLSSVAAGSGAAPGMPPGVMPGLASQTATIVVPDLRTNSLILRASSQGRIAQLRHLIATLDIPAPSSRLGDAHVVYLRNASAVKLAKILQAILSGEVSSASVAPGVAMPAIAGASGAGAAGERALVEADPASNSLIISAPAPIYNNLRAVIARLDIRRAQVFVQAMIAEVTSTRAAEFGVQWGVGRPAGNGTVAAIANFPLTGSGIVGTVLNPASIASDAGLSIGYLGESVTLPSGQVVTGLGALARALATDSNVNVLSTPDLLTLDNATAQIMVGQNVPFVTGSYAQTAVAPGSGTTVNPFQTIERKDVGLTLKITPQISQGNAIQLKIHEEVSSIAPATNGAVDIVTNKRSLDTTVLVNDGRTIVLGGLIENNVQEDEQSIPILGKIPLIGELFKYRSRQKTKTNLMIFLKPTIVRAPFDADGFTAERYDYVRGAERAMKLGSSLVLPYYRTAVLPPLVEPTGHAGPGGAALLGPPATRGPETPSLPAQGGAAP